MLDCSVRVHFHAFIAYVSIGRVVLHLSLLLASICTFQPLMNLPSDSMKCLDGNEVILSDQSKFMDAVSG